MTLQNPTGPSVHHRPAVHIELAGTVQHDSLYKHGNSYALGHTQGNWVARVPDPGAKWVPELKVIVRGIAQVTHGEEGANIELAPMSPGGLQASAGQGLSACNIDVGIGNHSLTNTFKNTPPSTARTPMSIQLCVYS